MQERSGQAAARSIAATPYANASGYHAPAALVAAIAPLVAGALILVAHLFSKV